jgi:hypothetical protein
LRVCRGRGNQIATAHDDVDRHIDMAEPFSGESTSKRRCNREHRFNAWILEGCVRAAKPPPQCNHSQRDDCRATSSPGLARAPSNLRPDLLPGTKGESRSGVCGTAGGVRQVNERIWCRHLHARRLGLFRRRGLSARADRKSLWSNRVIHMSGMDQRRLVGASGFEPLTPAV